LQIRGLFPYRESAEIIFQHITFEANPQKLPCSYPLPCRQNEVPKSPIEQAENDRVRGMIKIGKRIRLG